MADLHSRSVDLALRTGDDLQQLIDALGHADAPGGKIYAAYRTAQMALRGNTENRDYMQRVLADLRRTVAGVAGDTLDRSVTLGLQRAQANLALIRIRPHLANTGADFKAWLTAWLAAFDAQAAAAMVSTAGEAEILGDATHAGMLTPGPVARLGAQAAVALTMSAFAGTAEATQRATGVVFLKQAVAAIDERTTDCCLKVHGQTRPLDQPFHLTGTPRYADEQMHPGFHWYCRTAEALVPAGETDDALTAQMQDSARHELGARENLENRRAIHPANAYSRRG